MTLDCMAFFEYSVVKSQTVEIVNRVFILKVGLGKVKLSISVNGCTKSIVLMNMLYIS